MIKKIFKLFKIIRLLELVFIFSKIFLLILALLIIVFLQTIKNPENLHAKSIKTKFKNLLKAQFNQLTLKLFENIFSNSVPLVIVSYFLNIKAIIQKINDYVNFCVDKIFDEFIANKLKSILKKE